MTGKTHLTAGISVGLTVGILTNPNSLANMGISIASASLGSLLPDIDCETSTISNMGFLTKSISKICSEVSSHRRFWHTPIAGLICASIITLIHYGVGYTKIPYISENIYNIPIYISFIASLLGWLSHLLLDSCNPEGVPWLWPIAPLSKKNRFKRIAIRTASNKEIYYKILCTLILFVLTIIWFTHFSSNFNIFFQKN